MHIDFTNVTATQAAVLAALASVIAAAFAGTSAAVTAWINGRSSRRVEYLKSMRDAKNKQARLIRRSLGKRLKYYLALRASGPKPLPPPDNTLQQGFLPLFLAVDTFAVRLTAMINRQQRTILAALRAQPEELSPETLAAIDRLCRMLIILSHFVEASVLRDRSDPGRYVWRLRRETFMMLMGWDRFI